MLTLEEIRSYDLTGAGDLVNKPRRKLNLKPVRVDQLDKRKDVGHSIKSQDMRKLVKDIQNGTWNGSLDLGGMSFDEFVTRVEAGEYD